MNCCVAGLQWGDEGKGKVVDILAEKADIVVRYGGGANAGHTVIIGDTRFALHLMPSGAVRPGTVCVIANGVVVDPEVLFEEIDGLESRGVDCSRLLVSEAAHVIAPYHRTLDKVTERFLGKLEGAGPFGSRRAGDGRGLYRRRPPQRSPGARPRQCPAP